MKLYNTRTRKVEELRPLDGKKIRMYSCGPTVYDHAHIGNLSAYIFADTLRRVVKLAGFEVEHAMNYTDVDDKTIRRSRETYPDLEPKIALKKLTDEYIGVFLDDMQKVGNDTAVLHFMRATDDKVIDGMRQLIAKLHAGGFAYIADDGVYFSIDAYRKSGKTYGQLLELTLENTSEERIDNDEYDKESAHDFALWKKQKDGEPAWEFTLDGHDLKGRPGWHIECSVMSRQALGQPFDIHTGGVDLIFPHHENEIAQSTACETNPVMANIFAHNEHILVDGKKMAKSANNFYTLQDIIDRGYDPLAFRLLVLQAHYRSQAHFSWENLEAAQNRLRELRNMANLRWQVRDNVRMLTRYGSCMQTITESLQNDLHTPDVLAIVSGVSGDSEEAVSPETKDEFISLLKLLDDALGLQLLETPDITDAQKQLIAEREETRAAKDWIKSDELRDKLAEQGIGLRDTPNGAIWFRL
jgi:cysteinyl-tRNA synthetase